MAAASACFLSTISSKRIIYRLRYSHLTDQGSYDNICKYIHLAWFKCWLNRHMIDLIGIWERVSKKSENISRWKECVASLQIYWLWIFCSDETQEGTQWYPHQTSTSALTLGLWSFMDFLRIILCTIFNSALCDQGPWLLKNICRFELFFGG